MDAAVLERTTPKIRDEDGRVDLAAVNQLTEEEMGAWATDRLQGTDDRVPFDVRGDEARHSLFLNLYPRMNVDAQFRLRQVVVQAMEEMAAGNRAWQGAPGDALLMLVGGLFRTAPERPAVAELVRQVARNRESDANNDSDLSIRALQTLISLDQLVDVSVWQQAYERGGSRCANLVVAGIGRRSLPELDDWLGRTPVTMALEQAVLAQSPALARWHGRDDTIRFLCHLQLAGRFSPQFAELIDQISGVLPE